MTADLFRFKQKTGWLNRRNPGGFGTSFGQMQTREVLEAMQVNVLPFQKMLISQVHEKIDSAQHILTDEQTKRYLQRYLQQFIHWIDHAPVPIPD